MTYDSLASLIAKLITILHIRTLLKCAIISEAHFKGKRKLSYYGNIPAPMKVSFTNHSLEFTFSTFPWAKMII